MHRHLVVECIDNARLADEHTSERSYEGNCMRFRFSVLSIALLLLVTACATPDALTPQSKQTVISEDADQSVSPSQDKTVSPDGDVREDKSELQEVIPTSSIDDQEDDRESPAVSYPVSYGYTNQRADGNRFVEGLGNLPDSQHIDIHLSGVPLWLVSTSTIPDSVDLSSTIWTVVLDNGVVQSFKLDNGRVSEISTIPSLAAPNPPLLRVSDGHAEFLRSPIGSSELTPPAVIDDSGSWVYIEDTGDLVFMDRSGIESSRLAVDALPDGRILVDGGGRLLLLTQPTERYGHGVLGDALEAGTITLIETDPEPEVVLNIRPPESLVIEGVAPLWVDITGDGRREIVVTVSDAVQGAQIVVFNEDGDLAASGPSIGTGYRWRHQLVAAPFGIDGEIELVDVLTPHIGGVVEFYRLEGEELKIIAQISGYTSHVIGSRNLDMAVAGDFDGDGRIELIVPNQARTELGGIRRTDGEAEVAWMLPLDGRLSSNLSAAVTADGQIILGAGLDNGTLRLWP